MTMDMSLVPMKPSSVELICLAPSLAIARVKNTTLMSSAADSDWLVSMLEMLFVASVHSSDRFLSLVETPSEVSLVLDTQTLATCPASVLQVEDMQWRALQVASAGAGAFVNQLAILTQLATRLAQQDISVFQISTYQTDYLLVKSEELNKAMQCLAPFCDIEMEQDEDEDQDQDKDAQNAEVPGNNAAEHDQPTEQDTEAIEHEPRLSITTSHPLNVPDMTLSLVQIDKASLRPHMFALVRLLFGHWCCSSARSAAETRTGFLSYSEIGDEVSVVTSDEAFVTHMLELAETGGAGVVVSPDAWKLVQIGNQSLGFSETGIVARHTSVLLEAGTMVFYLSTYSTDFMLIKLDEWAEALPLLQQHFEVVEGQSLSLVE